VTTGPGDGVVRPDYGAMRASTADRERAVDVLKAAFAEGRLDQTEYADRVGLVYTSRTYAELAALTADLPIGPLGMLPSGPAMPVPWQPAPPARPERPAVPHTNGMAIAAFIFALGSFITVGLTAPLAIGLAIAAAFKMRRTGETGAGLVVAAIALAVFDLLAFRGF
jgi:hypothetical protein